MAICFVISTYPIREGCFLSGQQNGEPVTPTAALDPYVRVMVGAWECGFLRDSDSQGMAVLRTCP